MVPLYIKYKIILSCTLEIYRLFSRTLTKVGGLIRLVLISVYISCTHFCVHRNITSTTGPSLQKDVPQRSFAIIYVYIQPVSHQTIQVYIVLSSLATEGLKLWKKQINNINMYLKTNDNTNFTSLQCKQLPPRIAQTLN